MNPPSLNNPFRGWVESAGLKNVDSITDTSATWVVPSVPVKQTYYHSLAIFNSITKDNVILQPVLEWNLQGDNYAWTLCPYAWSSGETSDTYKNYRKTVSVGYTIQGDISWDFINNGWWINMTNKGDGTKSSMFTQKVTSTEHVDTDFALEATRLGIDAENEFCKDVSFKSIIYYKGNDEIYPNLQKEVNSVAKDRWPLLDVIITKSGSKVTRVDLQTPRGALTNYEKNI
jgi:hypothetical protein